MVNARNLSEAARYFKMVGDQECVEAAEMPKFLVADGVVLLDTHGDLVIHPVRTVIM